ncbi:fumarylacetoacetate hydrolase family protein [Granulicella sp. L60]|uniref:fumarylacetoacetate hydrolase family protein n=1 Tax=Granulicella sp. L60 TaxID=1641866 RepID=UPI00131E24CB|nr:fumarylacetoacetate hydrolase family protein [Granulicella sp. L60]
MILYRTAEELFVAHDNHAYRLEESSLDALLAHDDLHRYLSAAIERTAPTDQLLKAALLAPIEHQEVWASGVTYYRSRSARIEESKDAGGGDFYDRVYSAERPELFFKAVAHKVAGPDSHVKIRRDATWSVPEPELTLVINPRGQIIGYTVGNDMSSRDIEGVNPLYLPQAKVYDRSCALGPGILIQREPMPTSTQIRLDILRESQTEFSAATTLAELKRDPKVLVEYLFRDHSFPYGCFLLTGTGIVPPDSFTLRSNDQIHITIDGIGTLRNTVE